MFYIYIKPIIVNYSLLRLTYRIIYKSPILLIFLLVLYDILRKSKRYSSFLQRRFTRRIPYILTSYIIGYLIFFYLAFTNRISCFYLYNFYYSNSTFAKLSLRLKNLYLLRNLNILPVSKYNAISPLFYNRFYEFDFILYYLYNQLYKLLKTILKPISKYFDFQPKIFYSLVNFIIRFLDNTFTNISFLRFISRGNQFTKILLSDTLLILSIYLFFLNDNYQNYYFVLLEILDTYY